MNIKTLVNKVFSKKTPAEKLRAALAEYNRTNCPALQERSPKQIRAMVDIISSSTKEELNQPINGRSLLQMAITLRNFEMAEIFIDNGLDVNFKGDGGHTALHGSLFAREMNLSLKLLSRGADPFAKDCFGATPIDMADAFLSKRDQDIFKKAVEASQPKINAHLIACRYS